MKAWQGWTAVLVVGWLASAAAAQPLGAIRGVVTDADFDATVPEATVTIAETGRSVTTDDSGIYLLSELDVGVYTLVFAKAGYTRAVRGEVVVGAGRVTEVDVALSGECAELEEFVVRDLQLEAGTEAALLELRLESTALLDSIGSDFLSRAGAGDAAEGLRLVAGATTTSGNFAAVRGLPPRYVSTQLNGFVLPSADPDTRAVQLDLFPSEVIESIQVSKSFSPDQQGQASGGAVNIVTKGIPDATFLRVSAQGQYNSQRPGDGEFLVDSRGEVRYFGIDASRDLPSDLADLIDSPPALAGTAFGSPAPTFGDAPIQYEWDVTGGYRRDLDTGATIGFLGNYFWGQSISHFEDGVNEDLVLATNPILDTVAPGTLPVDPDFLVPDVGGGNPTFGFFVPADDLALSSLFRETQSQHEITWGGLGTLGLETRRNSLKLTYLFTQSTTSTVTIAEDTQGKLLFFPGHDPTAIDTPGGFNDPDTGDDERSFLPFRRLETQEYVERAVQSVQFNGSHTAPFWDRGVGGGPFSLLSPVFDWNVAVSRSSREQPGTLIFDSFFLSPDPGSPEGEQGLPAFDGGGGELGAFNIVFRDIVENSQQFSLDLRQPFSQWTEDEGAFSVGVFVDTTRRTFDQDTFTAPPAEGNTLVLNGPFDGPRLSEAFTIPDAFAGDTLGAVGNVVPNSIDFSYVGVADTNALYWQFDVPLTSFFRVIGGIRYEDTTLVTDVDPDSTASIVLLDPAVLAALGIGGTVEIGLIGGPDAINASIAQDDVLPSVTFIFAPLEELTIRGAFSETIARPTFRELTPVSQALFFGDTPFVGNPFLTLSAVTNYDLRIDYRPLQNTLLSFSFFRKDVKDPIQVIQAEAGGSSFVIPVNFPEGQIQGYEMELRHAFGSRIERLRGLTVGANATFLDTEVTLRDFEANQLDALGFETETIPFNNAPEFLYNLFLTYDVEDTGTSFSIFYTFRGDTLIAGPGFQGVVDPAGGTPPNFFVPPVFETAFGTLNITLTQQIGRYVSVKFSAENLTNPDRTTVYRSDFIEQGEVLRSSFSTGIDLSLSVSADIPF